MEKATKEAAQTKEKDDEKQKPFLQRIGADMNILREFQGVFGGINISHLVAKSLALWSGFLSLSIYRAPSHSLLLGK